MAKTCTHCGTTLDESAAVCTKCGKDPDTGKEVLSKNKKKKSIITFAVIAAIVAALAFILISCASNTPKGAVMKCLNAEKKLDYRTVLSVSYSAHFSKEMTFSEYKKETQKEYDELKESGKYDELREENKKYTYKVTEVDYWDQDKIERYRETLSEDYNDTDRINAIATVTVSVREDGEEKHTMILTTIKCKGKWYVM